MERNAGIVDDIEEIPAKNKEFASWANEHKETFEIALKLRDLILNKGTHASGYIISFDSLTDAIPMETGKDGDPASSYNMNDVCHFVVKLDLLGLSTNEIVNNVLKNIPEKIDDISLKLDEEKLVYDQFQTGVLAPYGLYQVSADCMYRVVSKIKPKNIYELSDCSAIARPGALSFLEDYAGNKTPCPHPAFQDILGKTRNVCLYQEEAILMAVALGFNADEGEQIRRTISKKKVDEVKKWKEQIYKKCELNNFPKEVADLFWKIVEDSAKYQFNAAHSISTSYLTALTVYLKYKYPIQFYIACLDDAETIEDIEAIQKELPIFNIKILPPDLLKSGMAFSIEGNNIRFGLSHLKGIADKAVEKLIKFRKPYANKFEVFIATEEAGVNTAVLSSLVLSGCLDEIESNRSRHLMELHLWNCMTDKEKKLAIHFGPEYQFDLLNIVKDLKIKVDEKGKPAMKDSRYATLKKKFTPYWDQYKFNRANEKLAKYFFEKYVLGFSYSVRLIDIYNVDCGDLVTIQDIKSKDGNDNVHFAAEVDFVKEGIAKTEKKTKYVRIGLKEMNGRLVKEGDIVIIRGKKFNDAVSADQVSSQDIDVFVKIKQMNERLKEKEEIEPIA